MITAPSATNAAMTVSASSFGTSLRTVCGKASMNFFDATRFMSGMFALIALITEHAKVHNLNLNFDLHLLLTFFDASKSVIVSVNSV